MIDLEERLETSTQSIRSRVDAAPVRPVAEIVRRHRRSRTLLAGAGSVAIFMAVVGITTVVTDLGVSSQPGSALESAHTFTLDLPGWEVIGVWESEDGSGLSHTLFDTNASGPDLLRRIMIESRVAATERIASLENLGIEPERSVPIGDTQGTMYLTEQHQGLLGFATMVVTWIAPNGDDVVFMFEGLEVEEGINLLTHLKPLDVAEWQTVVDEYVPPVTTTTTAD